MPGPPPKDAEKRQRRNKRDVGKLSVVKASVTSIERSHPKAPAGLLKATSSQWDEFWQSDVSQLMTSADIPALERLYSLYDERTRCLAATRKERMVMGSQGQPVLNPLYKHMATLDSEIRAMEDRFGLTPMARLKLGVTFGAAKKSLDDLNAETAGLDDDFDDEDDPRIIDAEVL